MTCILHFPIVILKSKLPLIWKCCILSGFLEKNRDSLSMDIMELVHKSSNKFLKQIFEKETNANSVKNNNKINKIIMTPKNSLRVWNIYTVAWQYSLGQWQQLCNILSFLCHTASKWFEAAGIYTEWPVPSVPGLSDEGPVSLSALLHTLLQTKWQKDANGTNSHAWWHIYIVVAIMNSNQIMLLFFCFLGCF